MYKAVSVTLVIKTDENGKKTCSVEARDYDADREQRERNLSYVSEFESDIWKALDSFLVS